VSLRLPRSPEKRNPIVGVMIGMVVAVIFGLMYNTRIMKANNTLSIVNDYYNLIEYWTYDARFRLRGPMEEKDIAQDLILLDIDDESWEWKPWPFERTLYAEIIRALGTPGSKTKATFFDVFFFNPSGPALNSDIANLFESKLGVLPALIQDNQTKLDEIKNSLYTTEEQLKGPLNPLTLKQARDVLKQIAADAKFQSFIQDFNSLGTFLFDNQTLTGIAPDRDLILHDAIQYAGNVYLGQTASRPEKTTITIDDIIYNPYHHGIFGKLIVLADKTKTKNDEEVAVNYALRNMRVSDFRRLLKETEIGTKAKGGLKALPFTDAQRNAIEAEKSKLEEVNKNIISVNYPFGFDIGKDAPVPKEKLFKRYENIVTMQSPIKSVGEYVAGDGYVMPELKWYTEIIRAAAPVVVFEGRVYPHIDLMLAMKYLGVEKKDVLFYEDKIVLKNCRKPGAKGKFNMSIPLFEDGTVLVNWSGTYFEPNTFVHRSFRRVYDDAVLYNILNKFNRGEPLNPFEQEKIAALSPKAIERIKKNMAFFNNKITLTGVTASDTHDLNPTPFHPRYPLVGMHANLVNTIVNQLFINTVPYWIFFLTIMGLSIVAGYAGGAFKQAKGAVVIFGMAAVYVAVAFFLFSHARIWVAIVPIVVALIFTNLFVIIYRYMTEGQEAKRMKAMFSTYVNPEVVETLIQHPEKLQLGGEKMDLSAMFAMASGPGLEDTETPEELVDRLNEYFTAMTDPIFDNSGMLDKYEGSIIMAVFGAPIHYEDNAVKICYAALDMRKATLALYKKWEAEGKKPIHTSVGINSGMMIAGNMGSETRFNYTIMGDAVNLSSRILGANKQYKTSLMISSFTYDKAKEKIIARSIDKIRVKGRDEPVEVFELMGRTDEGLPEKLELCRRHFVAGTELYLAQKWDDAMAQFERALDAAPEDGPSKIFLERCVEFKANPPGENWDGVYTMTTK
jgi:class 3 adenylate cyclase